MKIPQDPLPEMESGFFVVRQSPIKFIDVWGKKTGTKKRETNTHAIRIAIHPDYIGFGYGKSITKETVAVGFLKHKLKTIYLIVRKNNPIAQRLYANQGFTLCGETTESIQGRYIDFFIMKMDRENFMEGEI